METRRTFGAAVGSDGSGIMPANARWCAEPGPILWFTGLSGAGKSTLASGSLEGLRRLGLPCQLLDGDSMRKTLTKDLGYSREDRRENIRRIALAAQSLAENGTIVLVAAITPYRCFRTELRAQIPKWIEVFVDAPIEVCECRDPKGLYKRARAGEIESFTGLTDPYEAPDCPDIHCKTDVEPVFQCVGRILKFAVAYQVGRFTSINS